MPRSDKRPDIETIYHAGVKIPLFHPKQMPAKPVQRMLGKLPTWPELVLNDQLEKELVTIPLDACYAREIPYLSSSAATTIELEVELSTGLRESHAAQVWRVTSPISGNPLVARLYDPLYFHNYTTDRFAFIERAVAIQDEGYKHLKGLEGSHVPTMHGIFVAEVSGIGFPTPRHIYCVLSDYVPGIDLRCLMDEHDDRTRSKTCHAHKAAIVDCAARLVYDFFGRTIVPEDMYPRNLIMNVPDIPSPEDFCDVEVCPWRKKIHIDLDFPRIQPEHPYAPKAQLIDLELLRFMKPLPRMKNIFYCRQWVLGQWRAPWVGRELEDLLGVSDNNRK
ncbi:hypothetical protein R3P38DRAFT_3251740 [Favolaschia claudopus]|uniref:Aminoglycoside phosphotransferase domain-containing protein n=1 Tax=Favolaschia claudopus TaxID=2862362 RepID=A0AAW0EG90_9AGAR